MVFCRSVFFKNRCQWSAISRLQSCVSLSCLKSDLLPDGQDVVLWLVHVLGSIQPPLLLVLACGCCVGQVALSEKHKSALTWLKYYAKPMSDINELIKTLSSTEDCRQIGGSINGSVSLGAGVSRVFKDVRKQVRNALELWSPMVNGVAAIIEQYQLEIDALGITPLYQDRYDSFVAYHAATACFRGPEIDNLRATILQDYRRLITESHPHIGLSIFEPDCSHWKPNLCVLWSSLVRMLEVGQMVSQEVEKVLFSIEAMLGSTGVRQFQSGSLE